MGEYSYRGSGQRARRRRRRRALGLAGLLALVLVAGFGISRCLPQGLYNTRASIPDLGGESDPVAATLVVYNSADPLSRDLADFYAQARGIAAERVVGLKCSIEEEISHKEYDDSIAVPLRKIFDERGWWTRSPDRPGADPSSTVFSNRIRFVALIRGIPLKIKGEAGYPGDVTPTSQPPQISGQNGASVDSELATLGAFTRIISGAANNPYFKAYKRIADAHLPPLLLVCRLDAPTGQTVRRMITDSLAAEKTGLWGRCYLDARGLGPEAGPMLEGDKWIKAIARPDSIPSALPTVLDDRPALFSTPYPMGEAALYFGWYSENVLGVFTRSNFRFQPGAVAVHLHSFSAVSVRTSLAHWVGPLLEHGAAASLGNVYEPYLGLTVHMDILAARLLDGFTLAESSYAATPALSWMNVTVGDPLYRPGRAWQDLSFEPDVSGLSKDQQAAVAEGRAYLQGAQTWRAKGPGPGAQALEKSAQRLRSGRIYEGLGLLQANAGDSRKALGSFDQAAKLYRAPADGVRVVLHEARLLSGAGQKDKALDFLRAGRKRFGSAPSAGALDEMIEELDPPPPPPKPQ